MRQVSDGCGVHGPFWRAGKWQRQGNQARSAVRGCWLRGGWGDRRDGRGGRDSPLADALVGASETGTQTFLVTGELYSYVAGGLSESAANYRNAEQSNITSMGGLW